MSPTMTMALPPKNIVISSATTTTTTTTMTITAEKSCCPNCGFSLPTPSDDSHAALLQEQRQNEELREQVRLLNIKATAAVHRWAEYETELSQLRAASANTAASTKNHNTTDSRPNTPDRGTGNAYGATSLITQLLSPKNKASMLPRTTTTPAPTPDQTTGTTPAPQTTTETESEQVRELIAALARERFLRSAAEEKLAETSREVEDLSVTLFEEANGMVATERKARAALEERVSVLEQRDREKKERLGRLEGAVRRIERVQSLLGNHSVEDDDKGSDADADTDT